MLVFPGSSALSEFRAARVLSQIQASFPDCCAVNARFIHFADVNGKLNQSGMVTLQRLLHYGQHQPAAPGSEQHNENFAAENSANGEAQPDRLKRVVVPRIGTISPWSTKATDILHHCGLETVNRVERGMEWVIHFSEVQAARDMESLLPIIHDPMTESVLPDRQSAEQLFSHALPAVLATIDILDGGLEALAKADGEFGFALSEPERVYLVEQFTRLGRNPTDVELMMFAQVNSEHCRHKIFNSHWQLDGHKADSSLFGMIRETHKQHGAGTLVAYDDNAAVIEGSEAGRFQVDPQSRVFSYQQEMIHYTAKVETHNHPTAISPFAGAATGSGGEIRDEGATGRGGKPKAGIVGYTVSHLRLPNRRRSWEGQEKKPERIASPLQIMLEGPIGAAAFNNEFGRPNIAGYFRTFEQEQAGSNGAIRHGYHKPIMLAGGLGNIRPHHVSKNSIPHDAPIVVLGGPTMLIGLGGGAASSVAAGSSSESLDFASVQRGNPEMQRRCQEVIDACCAMGDNNPIVSIHDVGAGGLCNALPELVHDSGCGGEFELREVLNDEPGMTPMQIWCNESQERYVLAINPSQYAEFEAICHRERCLFARVGRATTDQKLIVSDRQFATDGGQGAVPIDLPMEVLFGLPPKMQRDVLSIHRNLPPLRFDGITLQRAAKLVLGFPTVADKTFLVTIGDRSVTGQVARDQMVGPWQVPVADVGVTASSYELNRGEAIALGERTPLALIDAAASGCMAVGEAITNIAAACIGDISAIRLSANWMVAAGEPGHDAELYRTVQAVALDLCPKLGISIPVGKDSMSMKSVWRDQENRECKAVSPVSLVVTAFARVEDVGRTLTPQLDNSADQNDLWLLDLGMGYNRLGGSVLAQVTAQLGDSAPGVVDVNGLKQFFALVQSLNLKNRLLAYHDRSDGGLMTTLCEMAFASRCGLDIDLAGLADDALAVLFNEELGAVIQSRKSERDLIKAEIHRFDLDAVAHLIGHATDGSDITIQSGSQRLLQIDRVELHRDWSETSWRIQMLRDNPECASQEYDRIDDVTDPGLFSALTFDHKVDIAGPYLSHGSRPKIAILREQGVNGQLEMAAAFDRAGFEAVDVTMSDLSAGQSLNSYLGFAACGGFSFGDVLGAGEGWAKSILYNSRLRDIFSLFLQRTDTFALGVCNGCQMMASIKELIPGTVHWPRFIRNKSEQYEARVAMVEVCSDKSVLLSGMKGSRFPVSVAHGEGRVEFSTAGGFMQLEQEQQISLRFVDNHGCASEVYPGNPNGSPGGVTGFTSEDGRFTIMMPHPERVFRAVCNSWHPVDWGEYSPWIRIFRNARVWVD